MSHFSKYGLQDSDEEEDAPLKVDPKKLKTVAPVPPKSQQQVAPQAQVSSLQLHSSVFGFQAQI